VNIAHGTIHNPCWNLHGGYYLRTVYIPQGPDEDPAISSILKEDRGVSDLQLHTDLKKEVCLTQCLDEAGFGLDEVGVFLAFGEHSHFHLITPYFPYNIPKIRNGGTDLEGLGRSLGMDKGGNEYQRKKKKRPYRAL
jgi:hypothetical protein